MGWMARVRFPGGSRDFCLLYNIKTGSGTHPVSYSMVLGGYFHRAKVALVEAGHLPPSKTDIKHGGAISHLLLPKHRF
jgi:hypothetical protein